MKQPNKLRVPLTYTNLFNNCERRMQAELWGGGGGEERERKREAGIKRERNRLRGDNRNVHVIVNI